MQLRKQGKHIMKQTSIQGIRIFKLSYIVQTLIYFYRIKTEKLILWSYDFKNSPIRKDKDGDWCRHSVREQQPVQTHWEKNGLKHGLYFQRTEIIPMVVNIYLCTKLCFHPARRFPLCCRLKTYQMKGKGRGWKKE